MQLELEGDVVESDKLTRQTDLQDHESNCRTGGP